MAKIIYAVSALEDIEHIKDYISIDSVLHANNFILAIDKKIDVLEKYPEIGTPVFPDKYNGLRQLLYKSYRIIYHYKNDVVTVVTIHHQSRSLENINPIKDYTK
ncbi:MAG: type II toxin-antitoxin system RelE/ParE family toxin [Arachidicoccus sp.]|nr:type II toxin-antitoxin system RelE/ParE family toxin [Arachidicoccus sp.]